MQLSQPSPGLPSPAPGLKLKGNKSLAIALAVSAVFLLAATGIAIWLVFFSSGSSKVLNNADTSQAEADDSTKNVKSVSFIPPASIPPAYTRRDQSTAGQTIIYYFEDSSLCGVTINILKLGGEYGSSAKEAILKSADQAESLGIKTVKSTDAEEMVFKQAEGPETYTFSSLNLEQDVNVEGVDFKKQYNSVAFKQFGNQVASIAYSCKAENWEAKKAELREIVKSFTVKTEK